MDQGYTHCYKTAVFLHFILAVFWSQSIAEILPLPHLENKRMPYGNSTSVRFWTFYRHLHVILQGQNKFWLNWTITERVMLCRFFKMAAIPCRKYSFVFWFYDISPSGRQRTICVLNFYHVPQSTAKLLLIPVAEDKHPPHLNSTPGFDKLFTVIGILWFCTGLPNFMQIRWSPTELLHHIDFTRWRL